MNEMRRLMEMVEPLCERFAPTVGDHDLNDQDAPPAAKGFFEKMRYRALYKKYKTKYIFAKVYRLDDDTIRRAKDLAEYYGYLAGENDISDRNLSRIQRQYAFDDKGRIVGDV